MSEEPALGVLQAEPAVRVRPLRRVEYEALVDIGLLTEDDPVELLEGELVEVSPQGPLHAKPIVELTHVLVIGLGDRAKVRVGLPLSLGDVSQPEPDIAVVPPGFYEHAHPDRAYLVIECAFSSHGVDLVRKARVYARAGIPQYCVVDIPHRVVFVHSDPTPQGYQRVVVLDEHAVLDALGVAIPVADLLPLPETGEQA